MKGTSQNTPQRGWILYDASCGFCRKWVALWGDTLRRHGYGIRPLQSDWAKERLRLPEETLIDDLRLVREDGTSISGADVYRDVMRHIWWAYPIYLLASVPGLRGLFNWSYRTFARNRFRFSKACGLSRTGNE